MKASLKVDDRALLRKLRNIKLDGKDLQTIEYPASRVVVNRQREDVPVDTAATKLSIESHITSLSDTHLEDEIGPETEYALWLEYGTGEYAEDGQGRKGGWVYRNAKGETVFTLGMHPRPYVRPSVTKGQSEIWQAIVMGFAKVIELKWMI